jgi:hypothetical protein
MNNMGKVIRIAGPVVRAVGLENVRLYDVVRVGGVSVADNFAIDFRAALPRVFKFLKHDHARAFAHDKPSRFLSNGELAFVGTSLRVKAILPFS